MDKLKKVIELIESHQNPLNHYVVGPDVNLTVKEMFDILLKEIERLRDLLERALPRLHGVSDAFRNEIKQLNSWVNDLQAGMYINCVYCGHRYGPDTEIPVSMADVLKEHIEKCPKHPLFEARQEIERARKAFEDLHEIGASTQEDVGNDDLNETINNMMAVADQALKDE